MSRAANHPDAVPREGMNRREFLALCAAGVLPRLQRIKAAYDPGNLFHFNQSIPAAG
jgi:FAD/FMN-containing dehydrogenase